MAAPGSFTHVAIVGLGLMGGSFARALRRLPAPPRISASSPEPEALRQALAESVVDEAAEDPATILGDADLVVYATPVGVTPDLLRAHRDAWRGDAVITDMGSVQRPGTMCAREIGAAGRFVGAHPMAGHHTAGFAASRADLFEGARVWLAHEPEAGPAADRVAELWHALGAHPRRIDAEAHDRLVAWASHLPQLTASALGSTLAGAGIAPGALGPGGLDTTRLAASPPRLWADILAHNADLVEPALAELQRCLGRFADALARRDRPELERLLAAGHLWRREV